MADTKDRRSEGKACKSESALAGRKYKALGICVRCHSTPVKNRSVCYACSDKQQEYTRLSGFRRIVREQKVAGRGEEIMKIWASPNLSTEQKELLLQLALLVNL
jgi:hypothetical protein